MTPTPSAVTDGKSMRLFLVDGTPGGLITAEMGNWTGHVITARRGDLPMLMAREEVRRTGVYFLLGDDIDVLGKPSLYIGESDEVRGRLYDHSRDTKKDWFEQVVVLTSKDLNLTKTHVRYLESRFITLAIAAGRSTRENGTAPTPLILPEADVSDMETFIEHTKILLPVLGINVFRSTRAKAIGSATAPSSGSAGPVLAASTPTFRLTVKEADATAQEVDGEFVVREGSVARPGWNGAGRSYELLRQQLEADGTLVETDDKTAKRFTQDTVFRSVSAAAAVVLGRNSNGRVEWKVSDTGQSYGEWQTSLVEDPGSSESRD